MHEAKEILKFDVKFARALYRKAQADDLEGLTSGIEVMLVGKSTALQMRLNHPWTAHIVEVRHRRIPSDSEMESLLAEIATFTESITNRWVNLWEVIQKLEESEQHPAINSLKAESP